MLQVREDEEREREAGENGGEERQREKHDAQESEDASEPRVASQSRGAERDEERRGDDEENVERGGKVAKEGIAQPGRWRLAESGAGGTHDPDHRVHEGERADGREGHDEIGPGAHWNLVRLPPAEDPPRKARR